VRVVLNLDAHESLIRGDPSLVEASVMALLDDASERAAPNDEVHVSTVSGVMASVKIDSRRPGRVPAKHEDPAGHGETPGSRYGNTLAMELARRVAQLHGGSVEAAAGAQGGLSVTVSIPTIRRGLASPS
ncbi:MAG TPA: hypothetical protein VKT78_19945, partial [Fimbriimonadaceae bacterium]|nr:hypothetical protein [Fimbriimonadaceae bacterium]